MIYAFDTYYYPDKARTVCLGFHEWEDAVVSFERIEEMENIAEYESGAFYKRELPCISSMLSQIALTDADLILVDGFVVLNDHGEKGLGGYLYEQLEQKIPVVGVAKNYYAGIDKLMRSIQRGESSKSLFVTALGMDLDIAAENIKKMHGTFRIPTLLKKLDQMTRA